MFYQRLWKYWSSTSSVKVRPGSYSESHWSWSAAFLTACSPTASSSCLFCCHSSSPLVRFPSTDWVNPQGATSPSTQYVAQSLRCWASVLSVGGTGGPAAGAWGHHMQHQHIARLAAQPGQPPAWLCSYVPCLLLDKEIEKEVDKARPWMNWWTMTWWKLSFYDPSSRATQATAPIPSPVLLPPPDLPSSILSSHGFFEIYTLCMVCNARLLVVHGMWMRLIEMAHSPICTNWAHLSDFHAPRCYIDPTEIL